MVLKCPYVSVYGEAEDAIAAGAGGMGAGMVEQFQRMKLESQNYAGEQGGVGGPGGLAAQAAGQDKYGLLGLLR